MSIRDYLKNACEEIDAGVFSGDVLYCDDERKELKEYVERWVRAIASHEQDETANLPDNAAMTGPAGVQVHEPVLPNF